MSHSFKIEKKDQLPPEQRKNGNSISRTSDLNKTEIPGTPKEEQVSLLLHDPVGESRVKPVVKKGPYKGV